ncbi:MAG: tetratricopeptide repeat protein [Candidatus Kapabacteria bacterium]|nr:tetratricopeptide repeat protein [Candidatus Kapabacteria bacterium]
MTPEEIKQAIEKLDNLLITSQYNEAKEFANELLGLQEIQENSETLSIIYNLLGIAYYNLSDYPKALEYYSKALEINEDLGNKSAIGGSLVNIGSIFANLHDFEKALEYYRKGLSILEEIGYKLYQAHAITGIGIIYRHFLEFNKAKEYYSKAIKINEEIGNQVGIAVNYCNIGIVFTQLLDYSKALEFYNKAIHIYEEIGNKSGIATNYGNIGDLYQSLSDYPKALEYQYKALQINEEIGSKINIATNLCNIGVVFASKDSTLYNSIKAEEYLQNSLTLSKEIGAKDIIKVVLDTLHTLRLNERQFEEALEYYKKAIEIEKEIQSEEAKNKVVLFDQKRIIEEDEKARQLKLARFKEQEKILLNILPENIADRILKQETFIADFFPSTSVLFFDIVNFTMLSSIAPPKQLVYLLDAIFQKADEVVETFGLEKIKTIGDGYLAVANVTSPLENHQKATALAALQLLETMRDFVVNIPSDLGNTDWIKNMKDLEIRIGIHTGEVVAGIIGKNKYTYDLWGDAVNVASRMESNSEPGRIHISEEFAKSIESHSEFTLIPRGEISIKGKGTMKTFWLENAK